MKVLIVDCYDSFTFNLYQQVGKLGGNPLVMTCDTPLEKLKKIGCDRIILSPGPGTPHDSGVCLEVLETMSRKIPTLGVCLGHQAICISLWRRSCKGTAPDAWQDLINPARRAGNFYR